MDELDALRMTTVNLLTYSGRLVTLYRPDAAVPDGAGGYRPAATTPQLLAPTVRYLSRSPVDLAEVRDDSGERVVERFVLIGLSTDDIRELDYFYDRDTGVKYIVQFVHPDHSYQVKAEGIGTANG